MTLGLTPRQPDLFRSTTAFCEPRVAPGSVYGLLHREGHRFFPDEMFADLFTDVGRRSVPPSIVAVVMVLQRIEGCSDREAVDRFAFDARWKYAAGGLDFDYPGFVHTVLVDMRARLARSDKPGRIFEAVLQVARAAGLVGRKRVLDSTPIYDAVATMDTVTLVRSAIRGVLRAADSVLEAQLRAVLSRDDDYASAGKPACDWDDAARVELVDALAKDRVISTVDRQARHGHKTAARGFDGYKGHVGIDPDSEVITATTVSAGNAGDAAVAEELIADLLDTPGQATPDSAASEGRANSEPGEDDTADTDGNAAGDSVAGEGTDGGATGEGPDDSAAGEESAAVYGDNAYGTGPLHERLEQAGIESKCKTQETANASGRFSKTSSTSTLSASG